MTTLQKTKRSSTRIILLTLTALCAALAQADTNNTKACSRNPEQLVATYSMTTTGQDVAEPQNSPQNQSATFTLWRNGNDVIHEQSNKPVSQWWHKTRDNRLTLTRLFEQENHAIEYQPADLKMQQGLAQWQEKFQLMSTDTLAQMQKIASQHQGCDQVETYVLKQNAEHGAESTLIWLPQLQLAQAFTQTIGDRVQQWQLQSVTFNSAQITAHFDAKQRYKTIDYADIGDSESDPFVRKMITLGFVGHGASGFYGANGEALEGGHHH